VSDYYVHVKREGRARNKWEWRILRRSKEIGVGLYGRGFATAEAARLHGEVALKKFLAGPALVPGERQADQPSSATLTGTRTDGQH
jgi:hypothetical protein